MPMYDLPAAFMNITNQITNGLSYSQARAFRESFVARLAEIPHPRQTPNEKTSGPIEFGPVSDGEAHLDKIWRWFFLWLLFDEKLGTQWPEADDPETAELDRQDRETLKQVGRLYLRWLAGDIPSEEEFDRFAEVQDDTDEDDMSDYLYAAWATANLANGLCILVGNLMTLAAETWLDREVPPAPVPFARPAFVKNALRVCANPFVAFLKKAAREEPIRGNPQHYVIQAGFLMQLMRLRWLATDQAEQSLFDSVMRGESSELDSYWLCLENQGVSQKHLAEMQQTMNTLYQVRQAIG